MKSLRLSETERFRIWELARKACGYRDQVTISEIIENCKKLGKDIHILLVDELPEGLEGFVALKDGAYNIVKTHFPKDYDLEKLRRWFLVVAHEIYHCFDWNQTSDEYEYFFKEYKAHYFAEILVFYLKHGTETLKKIYESFTNPKKIFLLINEIRKDRILLLGKYPGEGEKRLRKIESVLISKGLKPVIFGDLDNVHCIVDKGEVKEEVLTIAKLSQMVIIDDSEASGHLLELADLSTNLIPTAIIRYEGMGSTILSESFFKKNIGFMKVFEFNDKTVNTVLDQIIEWFSISKNKNEGSFD